MDKNGVSEVVGALLTVVVIVTAAGLIYTISHPFISDSIDNINFRNAVKNMAEIKEIAQRMKYGSEKSTFKNIQLNGGSISNSDYFTVILSNNSNSLKIHTLSIETAGREVVFESGIFVKEFGRVNPIPVSVPDIIATSDTLYISIYNFSGNLSAGGHEITVNFKYINTSTYYSVNRIWLKSEFCELWKKSFENALNSIPPSSRPADFTDNDCSENKIEIRKIDGEIVVVITTIEVS